MSKINEEKFQKLNVFINNIPTYQSQGFLDITDKEKAIKTIISKDFDILDKKLIIKNTEMVNSIVEAVFSNGSDLESFSKFNETTRIKFIEYISDVKKWDMIPNDDNLEENIKKTFEHFSRNITSITLPLLITTDVKLRLELLKTQNPNIKNTNYIPIDIDSGSEGYIQDLLLYWSGIESKIKGIEVASKFPKKDITNKQLSLIPFKNLENFIELFKQNEDWNNIEKLQTEQLFSVKQLIFQDLELFFQNINNTDLKSLFEKVNPAEEQKEYDEDDEEYDEDDEEYDEDDEEYDEDDEKYDEDDEEEYDEDDDDEEEYDEDDDDEEDDEHESKKWLLSGQSHHVAWISKKLKMNYEEFVLEFSHSFANEYDRKEITSQLVKILAERTVHDDLFKLFNEENELSIQYQKKYGWSKASSFEGEHLYDTTPIEDILNGWVDEEKIEIHDYNALEKKLLSEPKIFKCDSSEDFYPLLLVLFPLIFDKDDNYNFFPLPTTTEDQSIIETNLFEFEEYVKDTLNYSRINLTIISDSRKKVFDLLLVNFQEMSDKLKVWDIYETDMTFRDMEDKIEEVEEDIQHIKDVSSAWNPSYKECIKYLDWQKLETKTNKIKDVIEAKVQITKDNVEKIFEQIRLVDTSEELNMPPEPKTYDFYESEWLDLTNDYQNILNSKYQMAVEKLQKIKIDIEEMNKTLDEYGEDVSVQVFDEKELKDDFYIISRANNYLKKQKETLKERKNKIKNTLKDLSASLSKEQKNGINMNPKNQQEFNLSKRHIKKIINQKERKMYNKKD